MSQSETERERESKGKKQKLHARTTFVDYSTLRSIAAECSDRFIDIEGVK